MTTSSRPSFTRAIVALALVATAPLSLAACSSAPSDDTSSTASVVGIGAKWGACMRDAGFDVPDPSDQQATTGAFTSPQGTDQAAFAKQAGTCSERAGIERTDSAERQKWARQYQRVAQCIRDGGFDDFPDQTDGGISTQGYARAADPSFDDTFNACLRQYSPDTHATSPQ